MKKYGFLICLALILATMLSACGGEAAETTLSESTTEATTVATEPVVTSVDVVRDGKPVFNVVRDEDADTAALVVAQARSIIDKIKGLTGAMPKLNTDWVKRGEELDISAEGATTPVLVIPTNEELMIAKDTAAIVG